MTGPAVPGWDAAVEAGARVQQRLVNPMCPWDESDCQDIYRADAVRVLAAALPLVLDALEAEAERDAARAELTAARAELAEIVHPDELLVHRALKGLTGDSNSAALASPVEPVPHYVGMNAPNGEPLFAIPHPFAASPVEPQPTEGET